MSPHHWIASAAIDTSHSRHLLLQSCCCTFKPGSRCKKCRLPSSFTMLELGVCATPWECAHSPCYKVIKQQFLLHNCVCSIDDEHNDICSSARHATVISRCPCPNPWPKRLMPEMRFLGHQTRNFASAMTSWERCNVWPSHWQETLLAQLTLTMYPMTMPRSETCPTHTYLIMSWKLFQPFLLLSLFLLLVLVLALSLLLFLLLFICHVQSVNL